MPINGHTFIMERLVVVNLFLMGAICAVNLFE